MRYPEVALAKFDAVGGDAFQKHLIQRFASLHGGFFCLLLQLLVVVAPHLHRCR